MSTQMTIMRSEMQKCAQQLLTGTQRIWTFTGTLGAGKTTLVQEMLTMLGVTGPIVSPTYTYVCIYRLADGRTVYHFDLYRLLTVEDFVLAGFDEYLNDENGLCFIEWPEIIENILPQKNVCRVTIEYADSEKRLISFVLS